ncbi:MAG TPA: alkaline phosphatase family protein [Acidimicrobiales bacterium]|nr:alkaline phosphatase family protein [Acidimicrobiales bacterium]
MEQPEPVLPEPVLPDYGGACIANIYRALQHPDGMPWVPAPARGAAQVVLLVLDGLGWEQLCERRDLAPALSSMAGGPATSVVPTTTATALTSITTGCVPAAHGVVGYRVRVGGTDVLNVLRWRTAGGDARQLVDPATFQACPAFGGASPPVVTRAEFESTGFTLAHLAGAELHGWRVPSSLPVEVGRLLRAGHRFVYAYYDGIDKVAHERGFGAYFDAEVRAADRLVADVVEALPQGAALVVTSDHGQVEVGDASVPIPPAVLNGTTLVSGEGRFRWLHARPGRQERLRRDAADAFGDVAWVRTVDELDEGLWFGARLAPTVRGRLGDVAVIAHHPVAFADPGDPGELALRCRHGSVTAAEMLVPVLGVGR